MRKLCLQVLISLPLPAACYDVRHRNARVIDPGQWQGRLPRGNKTKKKIGDAWDASTFSGIHFLEPRAVAARIGLVF